MRSSILLSFVLLIASAFGQSQAAPPEETRARDALARMREIEQIVYGGSRGSAASPDITVLIQQVSSGEQSRAWIRTQEDADRRSEELIANAPLCSGVQTQLDRSLRSVLSTARWELEHAADAKGAAASAESLQDAVRDYTKRLQEVVAKVPEIRAARARLGFPMPEVCSGAEAESRANLVELQGYVDKLWERAAQPASSR